MTSVTIPRAAPAVGPHDELVALDRIVTVQPGHRAEAVRNVPGTLTVFDSHFPRFPVLPGVLILATLDALASLLMRETTGTGWRMSGAEAVRFRHFVRPGDVLELGVDLREHAGGDAVCTAEAAVDGRRVVTVRRLLLGATGAGGAS